jgi:hypothetical protein
LLLLVILTILPTNERLIYSAKYGILPAGEIRMEINKDSAGYYCIDVAQETKGLFSYFFKIQDTYLSCIDTISLSSVRFEKHIREGRYKHDQVVFIDQDKGIAVYDDGDTVDIVPEAKDIISIIYYIRTLPLESKDRIYLNIHADKHNYNIPVDIDTVRLDNNECFRVKPHLENIRSFGRKGGLLLYYTNDSDKIPIRLRIRITWGYIEATLRAREAPNS